MSTYIYVLLVFFLLLLGTMLVVLNNTRLLANKIKENTDGNIDFNLVLKGDKEIFIVKDSEYIELATELRELYPAGRKDGTTYMWRGTTAEVAKKLKTLVVKYGYTLDREKVIKATKDYISSFNGNYRYMQLLKYFILKSVKDADGNTEVKSELMSLIENSGQIDTQKDDWMSTMV